MDQFIAQITIFAGNFAPRSWAFCDGQLLPISSNTALFSLIGTTYGGDGRTTTALPDMRDRLPVHAGQGPGLSNRPLGQRTGSETITLSVAQIPPHHHAITLTAGTGKTSAPANGGHIADTNDYDAAGNGGFIAGLNTANTGGGQAHTNLRPALCLNFIIALEGLYPSRS